MNCPKEIIEYMHEFLDEEISAEHEKILRHHLQQCKECQSHFHELKKTIALVQSTSHISAPSDFTQRVMASLPKEKKKVGVQRWFKQHPFLTAASLFVFFMGGALFSSWNEDYQFSFSKQPELIVENDTVIVPEGKTINGDVTVKNGNIKIEGKVNGNVTVINGEKYLASAGHVTGEIEEVNQVFEWLWYKMKNTAKETVKLVQNNEPSTSSN